MTPENRLVIFDNVSKFYGEVLGVNRVNLSIPPGITSLVGPNGSGKTTLMNLMCGLIRPTRGAISVLGIAPDDPERLFREVGYCTQYDSYPRGLTGYQFIYSYLRVYGCRHGEADEMTWKAIERVNLTEAAHRKIAGYSKGMRQRIRLAQATCHGPVRAGSRRAAQWPRSPGSRRNHRVVPRASRRRNARHRVEPCAARSRCHLRSRRSSDGGYIIAEGQIREVRGEMREHPMQILIRCSKPGELASRIFEQEHVVEARIHKDGRGLLVSTRDADSFYLMLNRIAMNGIGIESVAPADDDVNSLYEYLIGPEGPQ